MFVFVQIFPVLAIESSFSWLLSLFDLYPSTVEVGAISYFLVLQVHLIALVLLLESPISPVSPSSLN